MQVLVTVAHVLLHDHESRRGEFHQLAYHRFFIMLLNDLSAADPVFDSISFPMLHAFRYTNYVYIEIVVVFHAYNYNIPYIRGANIAISCLSEIRGKYFGGSLQWLHGFEYNRRHGDAIIIMPTFFRE